MSNRVLVIGANSTLARWVVPVLKEEGYSITTAGRSGCDIDCDITKKFSIPKDTDVVINFAAAFGGKDDDQISEAVRTNIEGTLNICQASREAGVSHLVCISSIFTHLTPESPFYSIYSLTKRQADDLAQLYCEMNSIGLTILRPSQIYGDGDEFAAHQPFFYTMIDQAQVGDDIALYGSRDPKRNYIHSIDVAETIRRVVASRVLGIYDCANPEDITYGQIARTAQEIFDAGGKAIFIADKEDIPDNIFVSDQSLFDKIDYHPQISIEKGLKRIKLWREGHVE